MNVIMSRFKGNTQKQELTQEERGAAAFHPPRTKPLPWHPSAVDSFAVTS